ncbi:hypothetical protein Mgra_00000933 [Meloidogyne graminicola]|uniref:PLD phosphodiesterase domain-containing protein n=1 Tax=Meloidogyne graminicola TaxID=189291 RepID=A0A8T0A2S1_9BILA|nr:hypothetical protein Mgra_00000933 [Meloidogyne graminicola]
MKILLAQVELKRLKTNKIMENRKQQNLPQKYFETKMKHLNEAKNSVSTSSALQQTINYRRNSINYETTFERRKKEFFDFSFLFAQICVYGIIFGILIILIWQLPFSTKFRNTVDLIIIQQNELECSKTCRINLVESIVQNLSFPKEYSQQPALSTFIVWNKLINNAKHSILIAAYKSSLRGKHVLGELNSNNISLQGEQIFETIINNGKEIQIKMVENAVSKDKGDNEDGISLAKRNVINRRVLNLKQIYNTGIMHSKMIISDNKHFYLGSANLDWRSLTQKMELGVLVEDCPCLGRDLSKIFEIYWRTSEKKNANDVQKIIQQMPPALYNSQRPLRILDEENNKLAVHLSSSPRSMNNLKRSWDLNDIVEAIKNSKKEIFIHVMDYFPMFLYTQKGKYWPPIDNAIREAIIRGVKIKIISTALHFPNKGLGFLKSLQVLGERQGESSVTVMMTIKINLKSIIYI